VALEVFQPEMSSLNVALPTNTYDRLDTREVSQFVMWP